MNKASHTPDGNIILTDCHPTYVASEKDVTPDWNTKCIVCGDVPTLPLTEMCGPCTFGEAETAGGNW